MEVQQSSRPFEFLWDRSWGPVSIVHRIESGYKLIAPINARGQEVYTDEPASDVGPWLSFVTAYGDIYRPVDTPGLHRRFASMDTRQPDILRFANRFGRLGHSLVLKSISDGRFHYWYEELPVWLREIQDLSRLEHIWDLVRRKDAGKLGKLVKWHVKTSSDKRARGTRVLWGDSVGGGHWQLIGEEGSLSRPMPEHWRVGDLVDPAYLYLTSQINEKWEGHVTASLLPYRAGDIGLVPDCLLAAMYVQLAMEVSGKERPAILCAGCGKFFTPLHGRQRYCEQRCRKRKWWSEHRSSHNDIRSRII